MNFGEVEKSLTNFKNRFKCPDFTDLLIKLCKDEMKRNNSDFITQEKVKTFDLSKDLKQRELETYNQVMKEVQKSSVREMYQVAITAKPMVESIRKKYADLPKDNQDSILHAMKRKVSDFVAECVSVDVKRPLNIPRDWIYYDVTNTWLPNTVFNRNFVKEKKKKDEASS